MTSTIHRAAVLSLCLLIAATGCGTITKQQQDEVTVPSGTSVTIALDERLRTDTHESGDEFKAHTTSAVVIEGKTAIPAGAPVIGRLTHVEEPHRTAGKAEMTLAFEEIVDANGESHSISTEPVVLVGQGDKISDEEKVAGGAVIGGVIGALTGKEKAKSAAIGAAAGAAAGGAIALATKGQQLELPPGYRFTVQLTRSVDVEVAMRD